MEIEPSSEISTEINNNSISSNSNGTNGETTNETKSANTPSKPSNSNSTTPSSLKTSSNTNSALRNSSTSNKSSTPSSQSKDDKNKQKSSEFICRVKYSNTLPNIPFDPKLLNYPFDKMRFIQYATTSLDKNYKHVLHNEPDLGIPIDLIDPKAYKTPMKTIPLEIEDSRIVDPVETNGDNTKSLPVVGPGLSGRREVIKPQVSWLKKTQYLTGYASTTRAKHESMDEIMKKKNVFQKLKRDEQIAAIQETFVASKKKIVHPQNPKLTAVEILPVFPDFERWSNVYTQVVVEKENFEDDEKETRKSEAIIKAYTRGGLNQSKFFAYLVPKKRKREEEGEESMEVDNSNEEEYEWIREYNYEVKKGADYLDCYIFNFTKDAVLYDEINNRANLSKLKAKKGEKVPRPSKITVVQSEMTEQEKEVRENRKNQIERPELA